VLELLLLLLIGSLVTDTKGKTPLPEILGSRSTEWPICSALRQKDQEEIARISDGSGKCSIRQHRIRQVSFNI
jgi:hypothetical protein